MWSEARENRPNVIQSEARNRAPPWANDADRTAAAAWSCSAVAAWKVIGRASVTGHPTAEARRRAAEPRRTWSPPHSGSWQKKDRILASQVHGEAWRRIVAGEPIAGIVEEIRGIAGGRRHVLIETAGVAVAAWSVRPDMRSTELLVAGVLLEAAGGLGLEELAHWVNVGREGDAVSSHRIGRNRTAAQGPPSVLGATSPLARHLPSSHGDRPAVVHRVSLVPGVRPEARMPDHVTPDRCPPE